MADTAKEHLVIAAPLERCFEAVVDFERYHEWAPLIKDATVLQRDEQGRGTEVHFRAAAMGRSVTLHLRYDYANAPREVSWSLVEGNILRRYEGAFRLSPSDAAATEVDYELLVEQIVPLPGFVKRRAEAYIMGSLPALAAHVEHATAPD
jgi:ribosome-associated toxin RatA of RatAB toxin-antitoxin module